MGEISKLHKAAARQHGAFSLRQARAAGFDSQAVNYRLRTGEWLRLDASVYATSSSRPSWERRLSAALLSRPDAVLTHGTAARLYGLSDFAPVRPVLLVPRHANVRSGLAQMFESDQFEQIATTQVEGFPATTVPETLLLLARDTSASRIEQVFDEALIRGLLDLGSMARTIDREAGRRTPGTPLLRRLTSSRRPSAPSRSSTYLEARLETLISDPRMPAWTREHELALDRPARVDVFIPSSRLVIEADGRNWHTRREDFERDRIRDNQLAARGIQVLRFTYQMLENQPEECLDQILATIAVRAA